LSQAYRRFGSNVSILESGPQIMGREDIDVSQEMRRILTDEGIQVHVAAELLDVQGRSGNKVSVLMRTASGERKLHGRDILVAAGRIANTAGIGLEQTGVKVDGRGYIRVNERLERTAAGIWGDRGMRRQPAIHARVGGRFSDYSG
jgi:pyruvate/2-oxoglutarate dehydrogenase complex dihydrolipoamide dehydrogenase (E3) component